MLFNENFLKFLRSKLSKTEVALILLATIIPFYFAASLSCQRVVSRTFSSKDFLLPRSILFQKRHFQALFFSATEQWKYAFCSWELHYTPIKFEEILSGKICEFNNGQVYVLLITFCWVYCWRLEQSFYYLLEAGIWIYMLHFCVIFTLSNLI